MKFTCYLESYQSMRHVMLVFNAAAHILQASPNHISLEATYPFQFSAVGRSKAFCRNLQLPDLPAVCIDTVPFLVQHICILHVGRYRIPPPTDSFSGRMWGSPYTWPPMWYPHSIQYAPPPQGPHTPQASRHSFTARELALMLLEQLQETQTPLMSLLPEGQAMGRPGSAHPRLALTHLCKYSF